MISFVNFLVRIEVVIQYGSSTWVRPCKIWSKHLKKLYGVQISKTGVYTYPSPPVSSS
jgi:hypothetical protein